MRRILFVGVAGLLGGAVTLGLAEVALRWADPAPRVQILRGEALERLEERDGVVVWHTHAPVIEARGCDGVSDGRARVTFVGSSIFRGSEVRGEDTFTSHLQARADRYCVDNPSEPGFTASQKRVVALEAIARPDPPDLIVWEVWINDPGRYVIVGEDAINTAGLTVDAAGRPNPLRLPLDLNLALLRWSALYERVVTTLGVEGDPPGGRRALWDALLPAELLPVVEAARARGVEVWLVLCPRLDRPFRESLTRPPPEYGAVWPFAMAHGLPWIRLADVFEGEDVEALRADTCCHYGPAGHEALAALFDERILAWLDARAAAE